MAEEQLKPIDFINFPFDPKTRRLAILGDWQTGDIMHVAGALALHNNVDLLVLNEDPKNKDTLLYDALSTLKSVKPIHPVHIPPRRITSFHHYASRDLYKWLKATENLLDVTVQNIKHKFPLTEDSETLNSFVNEGLHYPKEFGGSSYAPLSVNDDTTLIAKSFYDAVGPDGKRLWYENMSKALASDDPNDAAIQKWANTTLNPRFPPFLPDYKENKPILLLWFRVSGFEAFRNSTTTTQEQLQAIGEKQGYTVVTIGDVFKDWKIDPRHNLGQFFMENPFTAPNGRGSRVAQVAFYRYLMKRFTGGVVQIGQLSGGMDIAALVGIPTVYIEDKKSIIWPRMEQWARSLQLYHRAETEKPPNGGGFSDKDVSVIGEALHQVTLGLNGENTVVNTESGYKLLKDVSPGKRWPRPKV